MIASETITLIRYKDGSDLLNGHIQGGNVDKVRLGTYLVVVEKALGWVVAPNLTSISLKVVQNVEASSGTAWEEPRVHMILGVNLPKKRKFIRVNKGTRL